MKKRSIVFAIAVSLTAVFAAVALAQGPPSGAGKARPGMPDQAAIQKFMDATKYTRDLQSLVRRMAIVTQDKKARVTPEQAKKILVVIEPLRKQPKLSQNQAKKTIKALRAVLTKRQLAILDKTPEPAFREKQMYTEGPKKGKVFEVTLNRGGMGFGGAGMGKAGAPGADKGFRQAAGIRNAATNANRPRFDLNRLKNVNPFYIDPKAGKDERSQSRIQRWTDVFNVFERRTRGAMYVLPSDAKDKLRRGVRVR